MLSVPRKELTSAGEGPMSDDSAKTSTNGEAGGKVASGSKARKKVDLYALLGVQKTATEKQLTNAYRKLALK